MKVINKTCEHCGSEFLITEGELSLYKKVGIELPTICFFCRVKQHLAFWMFGKFRKGKSDLSGESLITVLPKDSVPEYVRGYPGRLGIRWVPTTLWSLSNRVETRRRNPLLINFFLDQ